MELLSRGKNAGFYFKSIKEKQNAGKEKPTYQDYYSLYDASINFLEQLSKIPLPNSVNYDAKKFDNYFLAARSLGNIYVDVYEKQYTSAIVELSNVYSALLEDKADTLLMKIDHKESNTDKDKSGSDKKKLEKVKKASSMILKYGTFAATVAKAENSEEVKHAIEVVALPTGSSRIKRETSFNVSLNSYIGLFYGNEYIKGVKSKPFMNSYGVTAPVGVAFNMGGLHCCGHKAGHSLSVFVSLIDIGAIAAFRFQDDSTAALPKIELKDIISPGVFLSWGIAKSPISFSAGVQMGPLLRRVAPSVNTYGHNRYVRLSLSVAVDIPLLNLYTKPQ
jgi:hypothetical protein